MKLLPILAGTLMREAHATCNPTDPIIKVTCQEDLVINLEGIILLMYYSGKMKNNTRLF